MTEQSQDKFVTISELKALNDFLLAIKADMNIVAVHGFLTAIISSPTEIPPNDWLPMVFGLNDKEKWANMQRPLFMNDEEGKHIVDIIYRMNMGIVAGLQTKKEDFYPLVSIFNPKLDVLEADPENVKQWCLGYLHAVEANIGIWSSVEEVLKPLFPLLLLAGTYSFEELSQTLNETFDHEAEKKHCIDILPQTVKGVYQFWQVNRYSDLIKKNVLGKLQASYNAKNQLCGCGSQKKARDCCAK